MVGMTAAILVSLGLALSGETLAVAPGGLHEALDRARPGDTLVLAPGTHRGTFVIGVPLRITGEPGARIEGPGEGVVMTLAAEGIELRNLTLAGSGADLSKDDAVVLLLESRNVVIERCRVEARAFGIYVRGGGDHRIRDNDVHGDPSLAPNRRGNGIHLWHTTGNEVARNRLADVRDGVYLSFAHDNVISGNAGTALRYGIHYMYSERNLLRENRFTESTGGIALMFSRGNRIERNETHENRDFGILCQQLERSTLASNRIERNGRGLYLENAVGNELEGNRLERNGVGVYLTAGSERNRFSRNTFVSNVVQVYEGHAGDNLFYAAGRGNYWSDYVGFDWNGDGVGELPYRLQTATSALMARRPQARFLARSPLLMLLDWWEAQALFAPQPDGLDPFPLVAREKDGSR